MGRFSDIEIYNFLAMYKSHECLWNSNHPHYREKTKRDTAYAHIKDTLNFSNILEVKQKIKSLRDTYASERAKMRKSIMTAGHPSDFYRTKLRWYPLADSFLSDCIRLDSSSVNVAQSVPMREPAVYHTETNQTQPISRLGQIRSNRNPLYSKDNIRPIQRRPEPIAKDLLEKDEFYHFGMNVAMQLRSLPLVRALDLQTKFQQMLCETRIACEQSKQNYDFNCENERFETNSASLEDDNAIAFQDSTVQFLDSPQEVVDEIVKEEPSIEEITLYQ